MWRWTKRTLIGVGGLVVVAAFTGAAYQWIATRRDLARTPPPGRLVGIGGHRLHIWCSGSGAPSVILETGLGGSSADWGFVQPEVARFTQRFLWMTVHYDHQFRRADPEETEIGFVLDGEGVAAGVLGRLFAAIYARNLDRAIPNLVQEIERDQT